MNSLGHEFANPGLLDLALTHASADKATNNERLEYLGDAVLDLIVAEELYLRDPNSDEGEMTERKAALVSRRTLAAAATEIGLGQRVRLGRGLDGRTLSRSVLANLYEALVGAIYLDARLEAAREFILRTLGTRLEEQLSGEAAGVPKQRLQEYCQRASGDPPHYELVESRGLAHARAFCVRAIIRDEPFPTAWGRTVKEAESWAAQEALLVIEAEGGP